MYSNYVWFYWISWLIRQKFIFFFTNFISLARGYHQSNLTDEITTVSEIRTSHCGGQFKYTCILHPPSKTKLRYNFGRTDTMRIHMYMIHMRNKLRVYYINGKTYLTVFLFQIYIMENIRRHHECINLAFEFDITNSWTKGCNSWRCNKCTHQWHMYTQYIIWNFISGLKYYPMLRITHFIIVHNNIKYQINYGQQKANLVRVCSLQ